MRTRVASLVPGRVRGEIETDPAKSGSNKILLLRQDQLADISDPPGGLILVEAAPFSHPIIQWLGRGVPMALIDAAQAAKWQQRESMLLDSACGEIRDQEAKMEPIPWQAPVAPTPGRPVRTADGIEIRLSASVADATGAQRAVASGAASIGLVRSEYLVPEEASRPTREFYSRIFSELLTLAKPLTVTIRMLDLAADKWPAWLPRAYSGASISSLHGSQLYSYQTVREVVDAQLAALESIGAKERLSLIWPSGGRLDDFLHWRDITRTVLPPTVALGAMVESPLEMLALDRWLIEADFVSVGCNDLLQHLCAADRDDPQQRVLLDPYRPELFRFLRDGAEQAGTDLAQVRLCGLLPQIEGVLPILIGLGYRCFSGEPTLIPLLARCVSQSALEEFKALAAEVCAAGASREVRELLGVPIGPPWGLVRDKAAAGGSSSC